MKEIAMEVDTIRTVGRSGQISLGKALAGTSFLVEELPGGDVLLKRARVVPANEYWLHEPATKEKIDAALEWMRRNPPRETDLDALENRLGTDS
jgi:hypothetical protein